MNDPENEFVEQVLHAIGQAQAKPGLEARLLQRLAETPSPARSFVSLRWIVPTALTACTLGGVLIARHPVDITTTHPANGIAALNHTGMDPVRLNAPAVPTAVAVRTPREQLPHGLKNNVTLLGASTATHVNSTFITLQLASTKQEPSYPAPEMPLTEQERLLLQIAHRNDPVQVAMLDPVLRDQALARDRAESEKFFAPKPLPKDLQHEIDDAVRAQYDLPNITNP